MRSSRANVFADFFVSSKKIWALSGMERLCWGEVPAPLIPLYESEKE